MASEGQKGASEEVIARLEADVAEQGAKVKTMKKDKTVDKKGPELKEAVDELKKRKQILEDAKPKPWDRAPFEELLKTRFVYAPAFEIYGGVAGLYDYGPTGCAIKNNLLAAWRKHFVIYDNMFEIDCPAMTPEPVLAASGHVARFADIMVKDTKNGECIRADHLLEDVMEARMNDAKLSAEEKHEAKLIHAQADTYDKAQLQELFAKFEIKSPSKNALTEPEDFNMMFSSMIGPSGAMKGFLRPETAQGIFLAYKRLYEFNQSKLPFAGAQIGVAYRNEISPKQGVLRVREFQMAEIEHFLDPNDKDHPRFKEVADLVLPLLPADSQMGGKPITKVSLGDAVASKLIDNETLGYFIGRIYLFMIHIGANPNRIRFRQHLANEMAHYAKDCWDCEMESSYGWIECVGCADRSAYDLECHSKATKVKLEARVALETPVTEEVTEVIPNKKVTGKALKKDNKLVCDHLAALSNEDAAAIGAQLAGGEAAVITVNDKEFTLGADMIKVETKSVTVHERAFTPSVIEPSFGIGRVMYCLLEHVYDVRENDVNRGFLKLPPSVAPYKCTILPLSAGQEEFNEPIEFLQSALSRRGVSTRVDSGTAAIGRRYARTDEIGFPFGITVDFETKTDKKATVRERDSMQQIRPPLTEIPELVADLSEAKIAWADAVAKYGLYMTGEAAKTDAAADGADNGGK